MTTEDSLALRIQKRDGTVLYALLDSEDYLEARHHPWHMAGGKGSVGKYVRNAGLGYLHIWVARRAGLLASASQGSEIDHANGNKLDNRRLNLRILSHAENNRNLNDGLRVTNTTGVRGVSYAKSRECFGKPWKAAITENGRSIHLGWFATLEEAAEARRSYDAATDKAAWLAGRRPRAVGAAGHRGVVVVNGRFFASVKEDGTKVALGGYDSAEEAAEARKSYLAAEDKAAWLARIRVKPQSNGSSGCRGVTFLKQVRERQWLAYATKGKQRFNLGRYDTAEEAAAARRAWEAEQVTSASA